MGGVHGREGRATGPLLECLLREGSPRTGVMTVVPVLSWGRRHVTTLSEAYYETVEGRRMLSLIARHRPEVYLELHCYRLSAYGTLTDPARRVRKGVPPLVDVGKGVLLGSVSPLLASRFTFGIWLLLEVPCLGLGGQEIALGVMRRLRDAVEPAEFLRWLEACDGVPTGASLGLLRGEGNVREGRSPPSLRRWEGRRLPRLRP